MTWAKLSDTWGDDPDVLGLARGERLLLIEGIVWCCKHETDGAIPSHVISRITDEPEPQAAVERIVAAGFWEPTETGYRIVEFLDDQISADQIAARRADQRERQERSRRHKAGDHSLCIQGRYCPQGAVTRDDTRESSRQSPTPDPTRPVPTLGGKGQGSGATPPAPLRSQGRTPAKVKSTGFTVTMPAPNEPDPVSVRPKLCEHNRPAGACLTCRDGVRLLPMCATHQQTLCGKCPTEAAS